MPKRSCKADPPKPKPDVSVERHNSTEPDANETAFAALQAMIAATEGTGKNPAAVALGRMGGLKGGRARAAKLTKEQRIESEKSCAGAVGKGERGLNFGRFTAVFGYQ